MKRLLMSLSITGLATLMGLQPSLAQDAPPTPCADKEYRQMDFWVGFWDLTWTAPDGTVSAGKNSVTRLPFGDCVITERFDGGDSIPLDGMSVSMFSKPHGLWRQTWVDNQGGYFALVGGPQEDGTFMLDMERLNDQGPYSRMIFEEIKEDSFIWRWQGKREATDEWADQWVINYKRSK